MTNTYMLGGDKDPAEIIASIDRGIYATNFGGGQVDITSGKFVFSASEARSSTGSRRARSNDYPVKEARCQSVSGTHPSHHRQRPREPDPWSA